MNNYYDEIIGSIYYMLCSAYAQLGDDTLYDFIKQFPFIKWIITSESKTI